MEVARSAWRRGVLIALSLGLVLVFVTAANALPAKPLAGERLLRSDERGVTLELHTPEYELQEMMADGSACDHIRVPGFTQSEEAGEPQLPVKVLLLGVPPEVEVELEITPLQTVRVPGYSVICPAPKVIKEERENGFLQHVISDRVADPAIYSTDDPYPAQIARLDNLGFMRSQRIVRLQMSPFQIRPVSGKLLYHPQLRVAVHFKGRKPVASTVTEPEAFEAPLRRALFNYDEAKTWRNGPTQSKQTKVWTPPQPGHKVMVKDEGIYALEREALADAGVPVETLDARTLRLFNAGQEVAIRVTGEEDGRLDEGDVVLFYGQGVDTRYADTNVYWLTYGGPEGLRMAEKPSVSNGGESDSFPTSVHLEENRFYVSALPMESDVDHWYGLRIQATGAGNAGWRDYPFVVTEPAAGEHTATLEVMLAGNAEGTHHLRLYVNDQQVHDDRWSSRTLYHAVVDFPQDYLSEGNNVIRVELANDTPDQFFDMVYTDWLRVGYQRTYVAEEDRLAFDGREAGTWQYRVSGFSRGDVEVFDVSDPTHVSRIVGTTVMPEDGSGHVVHFGDAGDTGRRYLALTRTQRLTPLSIELDNPSKLQSSAEGADYIVVTHGDFLDAVQPLAAHRAAQGLRVQVVDVQDTYDEFGYGLTSAEAIRDFVAFAYRHWPAPSPSYVVLVGDGTYDPRGYLSSSAPTYIPPYLELVDPDMGETATDNRYVSVNGDDFLPDLHVGRLPANTPTEAEAMVNKILNYETSSSDQAWTRNVLFVADDLEGGGGDFYAFSDAIADGYFDSPADKMKILPEPYTPTKVYVNRTCPDENPAVACRQEVVNTLNTTGALLVSYVGHGAKTHWALERVMDQVALTELSNSDKLPIFLPMTCYEGYFHEAQADFASFGEASVRMAGGGAVASWSPSGYGLATGHDYLERGLFMALFHDKLRALGASTTEAKLYLLSHAPAGRYDDLIDTFLLFGDPALQVHSAPQSNAVFLPLLIKEANN